MCYRPGQANEQARCGYDSGKLPAHWQRNLASSALSIIIIILHAHAHAHEMRQLCASASSAVASVWVMALQLVATIDDSAASHGGHGIGMALRRRGRQRQRCFFGEINGRWWLRWSLWCQLWCNTLYASTRMEGCECEDDEGQACGRYMESAIAVLKHVPPIPQTLAGRGRKSRLRGTGEGSFHRATGRHVPMEKPEMRVPAVLATRELRATSGWRHAGKGKAIQPDVRIGRLLGFAADDSASARAAFLRSSSSSSRRSDSSSSRQKGRERGEERREGKEEMAGKDRHKQIQADRQTPGWRAEPTNDMTYRPP
ncbi:hypothetical protein B0J11DRAFT_564979 [Dendryphion nanum]|uniref:Uncharacterized protein n=1 Tax=Dendryphion nanum TaxID=256645 RepID=A0A9P9EFK2_9PLEO|nr:hypothetical protein B0J11DRAFT_564979 [Dendryphion nanum]